MDVRCERCQTEYEVEDASVSDLGTEVQCSDCGHLFTVKRLPAPTAPVSIAVLPTSGDGDAGATWKLLTTLGQAHDLRDLTQLHKWIVERRVSREDKISHDGQSWQTLGTMTELVPFFDIVDSAERARALEILPSPSLTPLQPPILAPHPVEPAEAIKSGPSVAHIASPYLLGGSTGDSLGALPQATEIGETEMIHAKSSGSRSLMKVAIMVAVAAGIGYGGIVWQKQYLHPAVISSSGDTEGQVLQGKVAATVLPYTMPAPPAPSEDATQDEAGTDQGHAPVVEPLEAATVEQSPAAQGYAALNRHEYVQAIAFFKEALGRKPGNGTALFGLAEAYRGAGQKTHALLAYRRYVKGLPFGPDAGSARFQIRTLERTLDSKKR